jgi:hypothetical protein
MFYPTKSDNRMAGERQGTWLSALPAFKGGMDDPGNSVAGHWYPQESSNLGASFELQHSSQGRQAAVYAQQQKRHFQPRADLMEMWTDIYEVVAENVTAVGTAIRHMTAPHHEVGAMRPGLLYQDQAADKAHARNLAIINSARC